MNYGPAHFYEDAALASRVMRRIEAGRAEPVDARETSWIQIENIPVEPGFPLEAVMGAVSNVTGIGCHELRSLRTERRLSNARMIYYYLARRLTLCSYPQIAKFCGKLDHTTVMNGCRVIHMRKQLHPVITEVLKRLLNE